MRTLAGGRRYGTAAVAASQFDGAVMVIDGGVSLQLWISSVALLDAVVLLLLVLPPFHKSTFQLLALLLLSVWRASSGVQLVATLLVTLSVVCEVLAVDFGEYHDGNRSLTGLGTTSPSRDTLFRTV